MGISYNVGRVLSALAPFAIGMLAARYGLGPAFLLQSSAFRGSNCRDIELGSTGVSAKTRYGHGSNVSAEASRLLDIEATLVADTEQAKRTIEGGTMVRRRFQRGSLFKRGKREKVWLTRWGEDVINADGTMGRMRRSAVIGTVAEFPTRRLAMRAFSDRLRPLNDGSQRPQTVRTLKHFV
jgi:hypothetical protein